MRNLLHPQNFGTLLSGLATLLSVCIAGFAVWISNQQRYLAAQQAQVSREKLRHDLFDRRYAVYAAFEDLLVHACSGGAVEIGNPLSTLQAVRVAASAACSRSRFLFNAEIQEYLEQLFKEAYRIQEISRNPKLHFDHLGGPEKAAKVGEFFKDQQKQSELLSVLAEKLECYLKLDDLSSSSRK